MTTQAEVDEFRAFQEWKASQGQKPTIVIDDVPAVTLPDVLCALVASARFSDEATVHRYQAVIRDAFPDGWNERPELVAVPTTSEPVAASTIPADDDTNPFPTL